jgi:uncharacterized protein YbcI
MMHNPTVSGEMRKQFAEEITGVFRFNSGRGPAEVRVRSEGCQIRVDILGFMTTLEKTLVRDGHADVVRDIRVRLLAGSLGAIREHLFQHGFRLDSVEGTVDIEQNHRIILVNVSQIEIVG